MWGVRDMRTERNEWMREMRIWMGEWGEMGRWCWWGSSRWRVSNDREGFICVGGGHFRFLSWPGVDVDVQGFADFCYHLQYAYCTYETLAKMMSVRPRTRMSRMTSSSVRLVCSSLRSSSNGISRGSSGGTPSFTSPAHSHTYSNWL